MKMTDEELDKLSEVVYQNPKSECVLHNVSDMFKFSTWVTDRFTHVWNTDKTNMLFFDKETKSSSLLIEDLYLVWYANYR